MCEPISKLMIPILFISIIGSVVTAFSAEVVSVSGSSTVLPLGEATAEAFNNMQKECIVTVTGGGTGAGILNIAERRSDIAMASRELSSDEKARFGNNFSRFDVGLDGVIIAVSKPIYDAGVKRLTADQIKKIYAGEIKNWKELGGPDMQIYAIAREDGSGTKDTFNEIVMGNKTIETPGVSTIALGSAEVKTAIVNADNAIGYLGFSYIGSGDISPLSIDGFIPDLQNIKYGLYKLHRHLYFYTYSEPKACSVEFIKFVTGPEGQKIAGEIGFIPL
jgi:phosphate transport system substrate-binding protein